MKNLFYVIVVLLSMNNMHGQPTNNPVKAFYGNGFYPVWTDEIQWDNVINMATYATGANDFEKFESARDLLYSQGGGVLYYPAGTYDFRDALTDSANGRGLMLRSGVVIRGEKPSDSTAIDSTLNLTTRFLFPKRQKSGSDSIPLSWNYIGIIPSGTEQLKDVKNVGIAWVELNYAAIYFGGEYTFGSSWATASAWYSSKAAKGRWADRVPDGTHPMDPFAGASGSYLGAGSGRLVFGCKLNHSTVVNDDLINFAREKYDTIASFYYMYKFGARIGIYASNVLIANNYLPKSNKNFKYRQTTAVTQQDKCSQAFGVNRRTLLFDYGKTFGLDVNKSNLNPFTGSMTGYLHENVVIRDNYIYNHGTKGFEVSGKWFIVKNNRNDRDYLYENDDVYGLGSGWELVLDGFYESQPGGNGCLSDNLTRAFDVSGECGWIDSNRYNKTGSSPGNDGEGILWQAHGGMNYVGSFCMTHNDASGGGGYMAGYDVNQYGALWAWNTLSGNIGNVKAGSMYDAAVVDNNGGTVATTGTIPVITSCPGVAPSAPLTVTATVAGDSSYIEISWSDVSTNEIAYRLEKSVGSPGNWKVIAYRPRKDETNPSPSVHSLVWRDYMPPRYDAAYYRVVAIDCNDDDDAGAGSAVGPVYVDDVSTGNDSKNYPVSAEYLISLGPNPSSDFLNVYVPEDIFPVNYSISDVNGKIVVQGIISSPVTTVHTDFLIKGIYYISFENNKYSQKKLLIIH